MTEQKVVSIGHNSNQALTSFVERALSLEEKKAALGEDLKELYKEAKDAGFIPAAIKALVKCDLKQDKLNKRRLAAQQVKLYADQTGRGHLVQGVLF